MKRHYPLVLAFIFLAFVIVFRSVVLPITHDEASTWINYRHLNVWTCGSNIICWGSANNHWLNTLLLQWTAGIFGDHAWSIRLPNVLAGILYLTAALSLSRRYITSPILQLAGFLLLSSNIYLLDFFSLARGYGLMVCGVLWGIYGLMRYAEQYEFRWLVVTVGSLMLAILANFTALLPWATLCAGWLCWLIFHKKFSLIFRHGLLWFVSGVVLVLLLRYPIKILSQSGEFTWGAKTPWETMIDLTVNLLYNSSYINNPKTAIIVWVFIVLLILLLIATIVMRNVEKKKLIYFSFGLLFLSIAIILLQQFATGSHAPIGRKSIYLIPFLFTPIVLVFGIIKNKRSGFIIGSLVSILLLIHLGRSIRWTECREWYYDANYPELIDTVFPEGADSDSVRIGSSWLFYPALIFYQQTDSLPFTGLEYQKQIVIDTSNTFYYLDPSDTIGIASKGYGLEQKLGHFLLFKRVPQTATIIKDSIQ